MSATTKTIIIIIRTTTTTIIHFIYTTHSTYFLLTITPEYEIMPSENIYVSHTYSYFFYYYNLLPQLNF